MEAAAINRTAPGSRNLTCMIMSAGFHSRDPEITGLLIRVMHRREDVQKMYRVCIVDVRCREKVQPITSWEKLEPTLHVLWVDRSYNYRVLHLGCDRVIMMDIS